MQMIVINSFLFKDFPSTTMFEQPSSTLRILSFQFKVAVCLFLKASVMTQCVFKNIGAKLQNKAAAPPACCCSDCLGLENVIEKVIARQRNNKQGHE